MITELSIFCLPSFISIITPFQTLFDTNDINVNLCIRFYSRNIYLMIRNERRKRSISGVEKYLDSQNMYSAKDMGRLGDENKEPDRREG